MAVIGWGKPRVFYKDLDKTGATWQEFPAAVEGSTTLETSKGDKQEAKIEGGENEDVRYSKNTYVLNLSIRAAKGRKKPIDDNDGLVAHNYAIALQPEDKDVDGFLMEKTTVSIEDTWSSEEGGIWAYSFDALKPTTANADQVQWGVIEVKEAGGSISEVKLKSDSSGEES